MKEPKQITVTFEQGEPLLVTVRQLKVSQYQAAFQAFESEDEARIVEMSTGMHPGWANTVSVDSYEELVSAAYEINASGFFAYAGRRIQIRTAKAGAGNRGASNGPSTSPTSQPAHR